MHDKKTGKRCARWVWLAIALYSFTLAVLKYRLFQTVRLGMTDLSIFDQALWNLANHGSLYSSLVGENILGEHTSLILYILAPLYALGASPATLPILGSMAIGLAALPVYHIATREFGSAHAGLAWSLAYLLFPSTGFLNMDEGIYGFHPDSFLPLLYLSLFLYLLQKKHLPCLLFALLALTVKEDAIFTVCAIGLYALIILRQVRLGLCLLALGITWYGLAINLIIPYFHSGASKYLANYRYLGENNIQIIATCLSRIGYIFGLMAERGLPVYAFVLLAPFAGTALLCPEVLCIGLPALCLNLLSDPTRYVVPHSPVSWHIAPLIPCALVASICGAKRLGLCISKAFSGVIRRSRLPAPVLLAAGVLAVSLGSHLFYGVTPLSLSFWDVSVFPLSRYPLHSKLYTLSNYLDSGEQVCLPELKSIIPDNASISASLFIGSHFAHRTGLHWYPEKAADADFLLLNPRTRDPHAISGFGHAEYTLVYSRNSIQLYKK